MKTKLLFLTIFIFSFSYSSKADHLIGGEITWKCLTNGKFIFYVDVYRSCGQSNGLHTASWNYDTIRTLEIVGITLPRSGFNNQTINQIALIPDSNKWVSSNNGYLDTECALNGTNLSCITNGFGTLQTFYYKSDSIQLNGTPPPSGWKFYFETSCCRPYVENIHSISSAYPVLLRSYMYANLTNDSTNVCYDSSPLFVEATSNIICRGLESSLTSFAQDINQNDSMVYSLSYPINSPISNTTNAVYNVGYSATSPTPNATFNLNNIPFTIDSNTGDCVVRVENGIGIEQFIVVVQVDSWRQRKKISSVFRELPITVLDCPPISSGINNSPQVFINNTTSKSTVVNVVAGQSVFVPLAFTDNDVNNFVPQNLTLIPKGNQFAADFASSTNCDLPPCAKIRNVAPVYNSAKSRYEITGTSSFGTQLRWQTDSNHLGINNTAKAYHFYYTVFDDHCPVPAKVNGSITVNVLPNAVGLEETPNLESTIKIFPNPNTGQFYIRSNKRETYMVSIINMQGQVVSKKQYENSNLIQVNLDEKSGIYILEVENELGERFQEKVIKL